MRKLLVLSFLLMAGCFKTTTSGVSAEPPPVKFLIKSLDLQVAMVCNDYYTNHGIVVGLNCKDLTCEHSLKQIAELTIQQATIETINPKSYPMSCE